MYQLLVYYVWVLPSLRKLAADAEEAKKIHEDQVSTIDKLEMQKALLQVRCGVYK